MTETINRKKVARPFIYRQAQYLADLAEEAEKNFNGAGQSGWFDRLEHEYENLEAVLDYLQVRAFSNSLAPTQPPSQPHSPNSELKILLRLSGSLWRFWHVRGYLTEGRRHLEAVLKGCKDNEFTQFLALQAKVLHGAGVLTSVLGEIERAAPYFEESLKLQRHIKQQAGITACLNNLGIIALFRKEYARAEVYFSESLTLRRQQADKWGICNTLTNLANLHLARTDYRAARPLLEESLVLGRGLEDKRSIGICLYNLGNTAMAELKLQEAVKFYQESLTIRQELHDKIGLAECLEGLAGYWQVSGKPQKAACLYGGAARVREAIGTALEPVDQPVHSRYQEETRHLLGQVDYEEKWNLGSQLPTDQLFEFARAG